MKRATQERIRCKVLRGFALGGGKDAEVEDVVTLPVNDALVKQSQGKVEILDGKKPSRPSPDRQHRDPKPDSREPANVGSGGGAPDGKPNPDQSGGSTGGS